MNVATVIIIVVSLIAIDMVMIALTTEYVANRAASRAADRVGNHIGKQIADLSVYLASLNHRTEVAMSKLSEKIAGVQASVDALKTRFAAHTVEAVTPEDLAAIDKIKADLDSLAAEPPAVAGAGTGGTTAGTTGTSAGTPEAGGQPAEQSATDPATNPPAA